MRVHAVSAFHHCVFLTAGFAVAASGAVADPKEYRLPLSLIGDHPVVEARLPGVERTLRFVVDSAASGGAIDRAFAQSAGPAISDAGSEAVSGAGGAMGEQPLARVQGLRVGELVVDGEFVVADLSPVAKNAGTPIDGILGNDVTARYDATYDYGAGVLLLRDAAADKGDCIANSFPGRAAPLQRFAFVDVEVQGVSMRAVIDTGAAQTAINLAAAKALGVEPGDARLRVRANGSSGLEAGKKIDTWLYDIAGMRLGDWTVGEMEVRVSEMPVFGMLSPDGRPAMILGYDVLRQRRVTVEKGGSGFCVANA